MNLLSFETSTAIGSVALFQNGQFFAQRKSENQKKHTEFLTSATEELLQQAQIEISDIGYFAVSIGPGSFTGIRVSVNAVRTYAQLLKKPVYVQNSLAILASQAKQPSVCILNAYKNMVYVAAFDEKCILNPTAVPVTQLETLLRKAELNFPILFLGDGFSYYEKELLKTFGKNILRDPSLSDFPSAQNLGLMAMKNSTWTNDWKSIIPLYIRASEAEENLNKK